MKKTKRVLIAAFLLLLIACSGSDTYRGLWKATNAEGKQLDILFDEKELRISQEEQTETYQYTQNSINISNGIKTYGIQLNDGRVFQIQFPIPDDDSKAAMLDANGSPVFIISRDEYLGYKEVYGL